MNIGGYDIGQIFHIGATGPVWRTRTNAGEALLSLRAAGDGERCLERWKAWASITSRHVVALRDVARSDDGRWAIVYDYVAGRPLDAKIGSPDLRPIATRRQIIEGIAAGVSALHSAGIVHGDLTPSNIIVTPSGRAVIIDLIDELGEHDGTPGWSQSLSGPEADRACLRQLAHILHMDEALAELGFEEEAVGHHALVAGFQGQRQWTDHFPNGDFMETFLNTQFDWNGIRKPYVFATENDSLNGVSMLFNYLLTNTPQIFADVRTYWSPEAVERVTGHKLEGQAADGFLHLINSGSCTLDGTGQASRDGKPVIKPFWELEQSEVDAMLENTDFPPANREYFRGGGFSTRFLTKGHMPVTMVRLNILKGVGPVLQIAEGYTLELPEEVHNTLDNRTDPGWPTTWFAPRLTGKGAFKSVYDVMNNWGANHGAITYGHIGADLITLASMLRIPVNMHNVPEEDIFRPKNWSLFGTEDLESADYRACQLLGPIHK